MVSQYDLQGMVQVYAAAVQGRDLGSVAADIRAVVSELAPLQSPRIRSVQVQGQVKTMGSAFSGLMFGLLGAVVLIYLLIVVNFQSWSDPFVIITALPAALAESFWMLFATGTTLSVPALTGAIMCMGGGDGELRCWSSPSPASGWPSWVTPRPLPWTPASCASARSS